MRVIFHMRADVPVVESWQDDATRSELRSRAEWHSAIAWEEVRDDVVGGGNVGGVAGGDGAWLQPMRLAEPGGGLSDA